MKGETRSGSSMREAEACFAGNAPWRDARSGAAAGYRIRVMLSYPEDEYISVNILQACIRQIIANKNTLLPLRGLPGNVLISAPG